MVSQSTYDDGPLISVVIPTYNRPTETIDAIKTIINQTYSKIEIIVVDDASTVSIESELAQLTDDRIKFYQHDQNRGGAAARNTGIRQASGDWVAFLDSDDIWLPHKLQHQLQALSDYDGNVGVIYSSYYTKYGNNILIKQTFDVISGDIRTDLLSGWMNALTSTLMIKTECLEQVEGFDEELSSFQEYDLLVRISKSYEVLGCTDELVIKRQTDKNKISTNPSKRRKGYGLFLEKHGDLIQKEGDMKQFEIGRADAIPRLELMDAINQKRIIDTITSFLEYQSVKGISIAPIGILLGTLLFGQSFVPKYKLIKMALSS